MLKFKDRKTTESTPAVPSVAAIRSRIVQIEQQLDTARQAHESHMAQAQQRIMGGADVLDIEAEAAGLRGNVAALESALAGLAGTLAAAVSDAAGEHIHKYSRAVAHEQAALHKLAVEKLAVAVDALAAVMAEGAAADGRLEVERQASNLLLGTDRTGSEFIRARHLALLDRIGPVRHELERLRYALSH